MVNRAPYQTFIKYVEPRWFDSIDNSVFLPPSPRVSSRIGCCHAGRRIGGPPPSRSAFFCPLRLLLQPLESHGLRGDMSGANACLRPQTISPDAKRLN